MSRRPWPRPTPLLAILALAPACAGETDVTPEQRSTDVTTEQRSLSAAATPWTDSLAANRDRLMATWAARMGYESSCAAWSALSCAQKGAFLTLTHRLQTNRLVSTGRQVLDHVTTLYGIAPDSGCGGSGNRLYFAMDQTLWQEMWNATRSSNNRRFVDHNNNSAFKKSGDWFGPHDPFNLSVETEYGHPRGQGHFWWGWADGQRAVCKAGFGPYQSHGCVVDWLMMEFDQDYNWIHDSSTECTYTNNATGFTGPGRQYYEYQHPYLPGISNGPDYNWAPSGCPTSVCGGCGTCGPQVVPASCWLEAGVPTCRNSAGEGITCPSDVAATCTGGPPAPPPPPPPPPPRPPLPPREPIDPCLQSQQAPDGLAQPQLRPAPCL